MSWSRMRRWLKAMEDIEDPVGAELRRLRERVRVLEDDRTRRGSSDEAGGR